MLQSGVGPGCLPDLCRFRKVFGKCYNPVTDRAVFPTLVVSERFLEGLQTFTYDDFSFVLGAFLEAFPLCFQEQVKSWF